MNRALSWSCKLCSPISSRLSSGYLLAFRCEPVEVRAQLHPSFQCAITVQVVGREPIHSGANLFHCYQHISTTAPMCLRRTWAKDSGRPQRTQILSPLVFIQKNQLKTSFMLRVLDNSVYICKHIWRWSALTNACRYRVCIIWKSSATDGTIFQI